MRLYSAKEYASINWSNSSKESPLKSYLETLLKSGPSSFIANVKSEIYILQIEDQFLPITLNNREYDNSYVTSIISYINYAEDEMQRHGMGVLKMLLKPILIMLKGALKLCNSNKIIAINNFLLSTNLFNPLSEKQIQGTLKFLSMQFPDHTILIRSLNTITHKEMLDSLKKLNFSIITSRSIYFFDPKNLSKIGSKRRWIIKKDKDIQNQSAIQIIDHESFKKEDAHHIKRLYDLLYLEKYSRCNPDFTVNFFEEVIEKKFIELKGILYNGDIKGVIGYLKLNNTMTTPIVGYDTSFSEDLGLYRLLTALAIEESIKSNLLFHMSSGVGHFKRSRGAFQILESLAIYCNHLPFYRRALWKILSLLFNKIGARLLKKYKL